jgi:hypothetical protein
MASKRTRRRERARRRRGIRKGIPLGLGEVPEYVEIYMLLKCSKCGKDLEAEEHFTPRKDVKRGFQYECVECRRQMQNARRRKRRKEQKAKEVPKEKAAPKSSWSHKEAHRKKLLQHSGEQITKGELIAETPRSMTFNLSLIIEQQLNLYYGCQIKSPLQRPRMRQILDDTLFEVKQALARARNRMKPVLSVEDGAVDLQASLACMKKEQEARALLGVNEEATIMEIKSAYRKMARKIHPDHNGSTEAMARLNEAYAYLVEDQNGQ